MQLELHKQMKLEEKNYTGFQFTYIDPLEIILITYIVLQCKFSRLDPIPEKGMTVPSGVCVILNHKITVYCYQ